MNPSLQTNPADALIQQAARAVAATTIPNKPDTTSHLFGNSTVVDATPASPPADNLSWLNGIAPEKTPETTTPTTAPAATTPVTTPVVPAVPAATPAQLSQPIAPSLNQDAINTSMKEFITSLFSGEDFTKRYTELNKEGKLTFSAPDFSKIEIPEGYEDDPVSLARMEQVQRTATFDAISQITAILPSMLQEMMQQYGVVNHAEANALDLKTAVVADYPDLVHSAFAADALTRFLTTKPDASVQEAKAAVKLAFDALKPKTQAAPVVKPTNWNNPNI